MNTIELKENDLVFAKVREEAIIPTKEGGNAGYDIYACFDEDYMIIPPHTTKLIPTGIASALHPSKYLQVEERGSTGSKGIKKSAGVVDANYRGEIFIAITNTNIMEVIISKLSAEELADKYGTNDEYGGIYIKYNNFGDNYAYLVDKEDEEYVSTIYPYNKAIAQLIVHEVPKMDVKEISYEKLLKLPSTRGIGALGSSGK